jgi:hypothetical protein
MSVLVGVAVTFFCFALAAGVIWLAVKLAAPPPPAPPTRFIADDYQRGYIAGVIYGTAYREELDISEELR